MALIVGNTNATPIITSGRNFLKPGGSWIRTRGHRSSSGSALTSSKFAALMMHTALSAPRVVW